MPKKWWTIKCSLDPLALSRGYIYIYIIYIYIAVGVWFWWVVLRWNGRRQSGASSSDLVTTPKNITNNDQSEWVTSNDQHKNHLGYKTCYIQFDTYRNLQKNGWFSFASHDLIFATTTRRDYWWQLQATSLRATGWPHPVNSWFKNVKTEGFFYVFLIIIKCFY